MSTLVPHSMIDSNPSARFAHRAPGFRRPSSFVTWQFALAVLFEFALLSALVPRAVAAAPVDRPNIVLIVTDDMGYADMSCQGAKLIRTPNLDRMAREGTRRVDCASGCAAVRLKNGWWMQGAEDA